MRDKHRQPGVSRSSALERLASTTFEVLVIGGGITGAGVARDAALRGMQVALVEGEDFASGTSSRSSRLIHGGLRYLEHRHFGMVFESSTERRRLLRLAPHLVRPLPFTWPVYEGARVPWWQLRAGLLAYDALALFRNVERHRWLAPESVLEREPALRRERMVGGAVYYDAATDDSRLTLANVLAAAAAGAAVANHVRVTGLRTSGHGMVAAVRDVLSGASLEVRAQSVVNAAGPWSDLVRSMLGDAPSAFLRSTKGVHIAVQRSRVGNAHAVTMLSPRDGRVTFTLPAGSHTIIGTTDTETAADPAEVRASHEDIDYLLETANSYFPAAKLTGDDVVSAWAGVRPLIARAFGDVPAAASREHAITRSVGAPLISISGGKLTTYRIMASQAVDLVQSMLERSPARGTTARAPLPGGDIESPAAEIAAAATAIGDSAIASRLVLAHGSSWREVWRIAESDERMRRPVVQGLPYIRAEIPWAVQHEMAMTIGDVLIRRTRIAFETGDHGRSVATEVAEAMAPLLGWSDATRKRAISDYEEETTRMFAID